MEVDSLWRGHLDLLDREEGETGGSFAATPWLVSLQLGRREMRIDGSGDGVVGGAGGAGFSSLRTLHL